MNLVVTGIVLGLVLWVTRLIMAIADSAEPALVG